MKSLVNVILFNIIIRCHWRFGVCEVKKDPLKVKTKSKDDAHMAKNVTFLNRIILTCNLFQNKL